MQKPLKELAELVDGDLVGDGEIPITGVGGLKEAKEGDITFLANPKYLHMVDSTRASAIIVSRDLEVSRLASVRTQDPSLAFAKIVLLFSPAMPEPPKGIHPSAVIGENVELGEGVAIGALAVIEGNVRIGARSILYSGVYVGYGVVIGSDTIVYPHVTVRERVEIGDHVIIHNGTVIGSDGFGYSTVGGIHHKIPQVGTVVIEDGVEIGANVTIDRARFDKTVIGKGTKIDNLVQIAHNVITGQNCIIVALTGISGSTTLGKNVTLGGQVGVVGHIKVGDDCIVAAKSGISKDLPAGARVFGTPARPMAVAKRINACIQRLPKLFKTIAGLQKRIERLEEKDGITEDDSQGS